MVSTAIIHVIGTVALLAILTIVSLYVYTQASITLHTNTKRNLQLIADLVALQMKYLLYSNTNISQVLDYPVEVSYEKYYNIYIGTGSTLNNELRVLPSLEDTSIYVVVILPDKTVYGYAVVLNSTIFNGKQVLLSKDPMVFGSTLITRINVTVLSDRILIDNVIEGVKT